MQITGTVIAVNLNSQIKYAPPKTGSYEGWELVYKSEDGEIRTEKKPSQTLKMVDGLESALRSLVPGDTFTLTQEKDGKYNKITGLSKGTTGMPLPKSDKPAWSGKRTETRDFESKEERAIRQRLIVRQSSITNAIDTLKDGKKALDSDEVLMLAEKYYQWVFQTQTNQDKEIE